VETADVPYAMGAGSELDISNHRQREPNITPPPWASPGFT